MKKLIYTLFASAAILASCSDNSNKFEISGTIDGVKNAELVVQHSVNGFWAPLDTLHTDEAGAFSFKGDIPENPAIYRLSFHDRYVYVPIDSTEHITVKTDSVNFDTRYTLEGSENAKWIMEVDRIASTMAGKPLNDSTALESKKQLANLLLKDPSSIIAFYTVEKQVDNRRIFDPLDRFDFKIIGAVATGYQTFRPNDPLTQYLTDEYKKYLRFHRAPSTENQRTVMAEEVGIFDINLTDENGKSVKLNDVAGKGKVVILNFTSYLGEESPAFNALLLEVYKKYAPDVEIYQVGYDNNEFSWKDAAKSLPWVTVFDPNGINSEHLRNYNVGSLPAIFIIDRNGALQQRVINLADLAKAVAAQL